MKNDFFEERNTTNKNAFENNEENNSGWYDNETDTYFEIGDKVIWWGDEEERIGVIKSIKEETFGVVWSDEQYIEYPADHQDAIKKA
ncbi:hypothetical protein [Bacillus nakamurai]|uniref:hypothetical protein n=1 Tax=Bacillus nakamurai TaxID=1793963 RepID=UPI001E5A5CE9|nr:hypothetical protein [Bacillus nakamurai]MCC9021780.1 hypothetical protein [Bacillus nakamurai]